MIRLGARTGAARRGHAWVSGCDLQTLTIEEPAFPLGGAGFFVKVGPVLGPLVGEGARLFDEGRFFEAHEAWEEHWLVERDETRRRFLQGLIQVAAAFHKLVVSQAPLPAASLFAKALAKLDVCPCAMEGIDVAAFREAVRTCASELVAGRFDATAIPRLVT